MNSIPLCSRGRAPGLLFLCTFKQVWTFLSPRVCDTPVSLGPLFYQVLQSPLFSPLTAWFTAAALPAAVVVSKRDTDACRRAAFSCQRAASGLFVAESCQHSAGFLKDLPRLLHLLSLVLPPAPAHCLVGVVQHVNMGLWDSNGTVITHQLHVCNA